MAQTYIFGDKYFKQRLIDFKLEDIPDIEEKRKVIARYMQSLNSGRIERTKEEAIQADFLNNFFGDVLGYDYKDAKKWNLAKEHKSETDTTKADGALGFFTLTDTGIKADVRVVIELKDALTELDKPQNRLNDKRTPVEQAFSYSSKAGGKCKWVIVSNFKEIRLYHATDQGNYEKFVLAELSKDDNLKRFFYILQKEHLISETSESPIEKLYRERQEIEQHITKKFYNTYKTLRVALFEHLKEQNTGKEELLLFNKAQKILDRLIFVCFAEDKNLLPPYTLHKTKEVLKNAFDFEENKLWRQFKGLFHSIDKGNPPMDISKFNGGLFAKDDELDDLVIMDDMLLRLVEISEFDFESELNVNILGHIFEQSLSDIEEIKAQIGNGKDLSKDEKAEVKKNGKRKKEGIFYTPEYITRYIVKEAIGGWLEDRKKELGFYDLPELTSEDLQSIKIEKKKNKKTGKFEETLTANTVVNSYITFWEAYRDKLRHIKVLDPACGSGAFLNQTFDYLYAEGQAVNDQLSALRLGQRELFELDKHILINNIFGVDLNPESVEITKLSLWLKTANKGKELTALDDNIKCGNSLIDDKTISGDRAFNWFEEFPQVFPHYRKPKAEITKEEPEPGDKDYLDEVQDPSYSYKQGSKGFEKYGFDVVIGNPPYVVYIKSIVGEQTLKYINNRFKFAEYNPNTYALFTDLALNKILNNKGYLGFIIPNSWLDGLYFSKMREGVFNKFISGILYLKGTVFQEIVETVVLLVKNENSVPDKIKLSTSLIDNEFTIEKFDRQKYIDGFNPFTSKENFLINRIESNNDKLKNYAIVYRGIETKDNSKWLSDSKESSVYFPILLGKDVNRYHYSQSGTHIKFIKNEMKSNANEVMYNQPKILMRRTGSSIIAALDTNNYFALKNLYLIIPKEKTNIYALLAQLNSKLFKYYHITKSSGENKAFAQFKGIYIENFPFINSEDSRFEILVNELINKYYELYKLKINFKNIVLNNFKIDLLSPKIESFYNIEFKEFLKELKKQNIRIPLKDQPEWLQYFDKEKSNSNNLKLLIESTEKGIDRMVFELYGLTEEEIKIVEGA